MHSWEQKRSRGNLGKGETADRRWDAALYSLCGADILAWGRSSGRDQRGSRNKDSVSVGHWSKSHHLFQSCFVSLFGQEGGKLNGESAPNTTDSPSPSNFSSHLVISSNLHMDWSIVPLNVWSAWLGLLCYSDRHFELGLSSGFCWCWLHQSSDCNFVFSSLPALFSFCRCPRATLGVFNCSFLANKNIGCSIWIQTQRAERLLFLQRSWRAGPRPVLSLEPFFLFPLPKKMALELKNWSQLHHFFAGPEVRTSYIIETNENNKFDSFSRCAIWEKWWNGR